MPRLSERLLFQIFILLKCTSPTDCLVLTYNFNWARSSQLFEHQSTGEIQGYKSMVSSIPDNLRVSNVKTRQNTELSKSQVISTN